MFHIYTDEQESPRAGDWRPESGPIGGKDTPTATSVRKAKVLVTGHTDDEIMLAPKLPFDSLAALKRAVEIVLQSLPEPSVTLSSLQHRDSDGDLVDLLESTFDPQDFASLEKIYLRAKVQPVEQKTKARCKKQAPGTDVRRVLGRRDPNTVASTPMNSRSKASTGTTAPSTSRTNKARNLCGASPAASLDESRCATRTPMERQGRVRSTPRSCYPRPQAPDFESGAGGSCLITPARRPALEGLVTATGGKLQGAARREKAKASPAPRPSWDIRIEPKWMEVRPEQASCLGSLVLSSGVSVLEREGHGNNEGNTAWTPNTHPVADGCNRR